MRVLITGMGGFVAPHMVQEFVSHGHTVWGTGMTPLKDPRIVGGEVIIADLRDQQSTREVIKVAQPEAVIHLAAQSSPARSWEIPMETFRSNIMCTIEVVRAAAQVSENPIVAVASTSDLYGIPNPEDLPITEKSPLRPHTPYAVSKLAAEYAARIYAQRHGARVIIVRSFNHTGPGQTANFVVPAFARQIAEVEAGKAEKVRHGDLNAYRDFVDVRDVARAYRMITESGLTEGLFNVCSGKAYKIEFLLKELCRLSTTEVKTEVDPRRARGEPGNELRGDYSLINDAIGWEPRITVEETLRSVLDEQRWLVRTGSS